MEYLHERATDYNSSCLRLAATSRQVAAAARNNRIPFPANSLRQKMASLAVATACAPFPHTGISGLPFPSIGTYSLPVVFLKRKLKRHGSIDANS
jgi:hypothetical protein